jgi:hypothetical protein
VLLRAWEWEEPVAAAVRQACPAAASVPAARAIPEQRAMPEQQAMAAALGWEREAQRGPLEWAAREAEPTCALFKFGVHRFCEINAFALQEVFHDADARLAILIDRDPLKLVADGFAVLVEGRAFGTQRGEIGIQQDLAVDVAGGGGIVDRCQDHC